MKVSQLLAVGFAVIASLHAPSRGTEPAPATSGDHFQLTILTVNMKKIFESHPMTIEAEKKINERRNSTGKRAAMEIPGLDQSKTLLEEVKKLDADLASGKLEGAERTQALRLRSEKMDALKELDEGIRKFQKAREKELQDEAVRMRAEIVADIMKAIAATPELKEASLVLDSSGFSLNGVPVISWGDPKLDRTAAVQRQIGINAGVNLNKAGRNQK